MEKTTANPKEYTLDKKLYREVLRDIKTKSKETFKLLNNTGKKFNLPLHK